MAVTEIIRGSSDQQGWRVEAMEIPWSEMRNSGFIDLAITREKAIGIIECKKVNNADSLVFLVHRDQDASVTRCTLEVYMQELPESGGYELPGMRAMQMQSECRYAVADCNMLAKSPESSYCVAPKGPRSANLDLDGIASNLLESCEGLLGDWNFVLSARRTACIPIIVTNAHLYTCTFDPAQMDLGSSDLPKLASFQTQPFVRFRKAFRHSGGRLAPDEKDSLAQVMEECTRTVFVVNARGIVPFLAGLRGVSMQVSGRTYDFVSG